MNNTDNIDINNNFFLDGRKYTFWNMPPTESLPILGQILPILQDSASYFLEEHLEELNNFDPTQGKKKLDEVILRFLKPLTEKFNGNEIIGLMRAVFRYIRLDGKIIEIDSSFIGKNKHMIHIFLYTLIYNFSDFLGYGLLNFLSSSI